MIRIFAILAWAVCCCCWAAPARSAASADEFVLATGGQIVGEWLNPSEVPRQSYQIRLPVGATITLAESQVRQVVRRRPEEAEYERLWPRAADTVDAQWQLAEWCRERTLSAQREKHLKRILELDPGHEGARRALGFFERQGEWTTRDDRMKAQGYVLYKGQWQLPQQVKLREEAEALRAAEGKWSQDLNRWRGWLKTDRAVAAKSNILGIKDPFAVKAIVEALDGERDEQIRKIYVEALAHIGSASALRALAFRALSDPVEEVRLTCLDYLKKSPNVEVMQLFVTRLSSKDNTEINRAAIALGALADPAAIDPLINVLVTNHKQVTPGRDPRQMSVGFGSNGGSGMSMGGGPKVVQYNVQNRAVLDALVSLAGGPNFGFDQKAWKAWYASQHRFQDELNARRD